MIFEEKQKTQPIERWEVWEAFKEVRANGESPGVDGVTIDTVASYPRKYLYPVWSRMASGSYFPKAVRQAEIPKEDGSKRLLGIPTVTDRVAQTVIKWKLEKYTNGHFSSNSFGYIEGKSQHDAIEQCRINCLKHRWVIDLDIKGFFDNIDHELLMRAVQWFTKEKCILMYVERWLKAPVLLLNGTLKESDGKGTPQGGVISPLLANIFLHFVFDKWYNRQYPEGKFERYADDIIVHCDSFMEAQARLEAIEQRLKECKLEVNRSKTKIVHCQNSHKRQAPNNEVKRSFDFLGYTFKPRYVMFKGKIRIGFTPGMSRKKQKRISDLLFKMRIHRMTHFSIQQIADMLKSKIRGWINYYGKFRKSEMGYLFSLLNNRLARWARNKYGRFKNRHLYIAHLWLVNVSKAFPNLFVHWQHGFFPK
jgi:group II intron reverse transcriptase/maturase